MRLHLVLASFVMVAWSFSAMAAPESNSELVEITARDQADRRNSSSKIDWLAVNQRDKQRRDRVLQMLREGNIRTDADYYNAALVFQHGATPEEIRLAHALSYTAQQINPDNKSAVWLTAASWDRLLMQLGQPQWYATQFVKRDGRWVLYQVNEQVISDEERTRVGGRSLKDAQTHAELLNTQ